MGAGHLLRLLLLLLGLSSSVLAEATVLSLDQGDFVLSNRATPPGDDAPWQPQTLPDRWKLSRPGESGSGWYRLPFEAASGPEGLQAIYLPKLGLNAAVFINGVPVGSGGRFDEPISRNWNRPLIFVIPPGLIHAGRNVVHVRLRSHAYTQAHLYPPRVGPEPELRPAHDRTFFLRITLNQVTSLLIAAIGVLTLTLWWRRRKETAYGYFGASALVWAFQSTNLYLRDVPFSTASWEIAINGSFQVFAVLLLMSLLRFVDSACRPLDRALKLLLVIAPLSLALAPAEYFLSLTSLWHLLTLSAALITLVLIVRAALRGRNRDARTLIGAMGVIVILAAHDWFIHSQHFWTLPGGSFLQDIYLLHYSAPVLFLVVGWIMTARYVRVLNEFEALNSELEARVRTKAAELEGSYIRMRALEMERVVLDERERIYRDLHDDVGAKLLSLVYRASDAGNADLARSALQDLRDVVSRTGADHYSLDEAVADWRAECEQRLQDAEIRLEWLSAGNMEGVELSQPQAVNTGRVLREAVSNIIRHAEAKEVVIAITCSGRTLGVEVRDDGIGCPEGPSGMGRGLRNMESRARRLKGSLLRESVEPHGCRVILSLPLDSPEDSGNAP